MSNAQSRPIFAGFQSATVTEAAEIRAAELASHGRICEVAVSLFDAAGLSFVLPGKKGASPKGAHATYQTLAGGVKPVFSKDVREALAGTVKGWAEVTQGLHSLVSMLHAAGVCDAPAPLPAWADPVAIAEAKAQAKAKREQAKAKATTQAGAGEGEGEGEAMDSEATTVQAAPSAPAANLIAAAIKAKAYTSAEIALIIKALHDANVLARETVQAPAQEAAEA